MRESECVVGTKVIFKTFNEKAVIVSEPDEMGAIEIELESGGKISTFAGDLELRKK